MGLLSALFLATESLSHGVKSLQSNGRSQIHYRSYFPSSGLLLILASKPADISNGKEEIHEEQEDEEDDIHDDDDGIVSSLFDESAYCQRILSTAHDLILMMLGPKSQFSDIGSVDRLKRQLRITYPILDYLISDTIIPDIVSSLPTVSIPSQRVLLTQILQDFSSLCDTAMSAIVIDQGKQFSVCLEDWWNLDPSESVLLSLLIKALPPSTSARDLPIYLLKSSPDSATRFITLTLMPGIDVLLLCGPEPSLEEIKSDIVPRILAPRKDLFEELISPTSIPRCLPDSFPVPSPFFGFMLVHRLRAKSLISIDPTRIAAGTCFSDPSSSGNMKNPLLPCPPGSQKASPSAVVESALLQFYWDAFPQFEYAYRKYTDEVVRRHQMIQLEVNSNNQSSNVEEVEGSSAMDSPGLPPSGRRSSSGKGFTSMLASMVRRKSTAEEQEQAELSANRANEVLKLLEDAQESGRPSGFQPREPDAARMFLVREVYELSTGYALCAIARPPMELYAVIPSSMPPEIAIPALESLLNSLTVGSSKAPAVFQ